MKRSSSFLCLLFAFTVYSFALDVITIDDFSTPTAWKAVNKVTVAPAEGPDGAKAIAVSNLPYGTASHKLSFTNEELDVWDKYQGISFYVKGDGSDCWSPVAISNSYGSYSYVYFVPLKSTEWVKYTVAWRDFIPEGFAGLIGEPNGIPPCGINELRVGCRWNIWFNNDKIPAHTLTLANVVLEPVVAVDNTPYKPAPFSKILDKLRKREKLIIQFQGDSITAGTSLRDKVNERYSIKTEELLREWLKTENIICVNRAVGGARTNDERAWLNRDFSGETPDLVTLWIGYNDRSGTAAASYYKSAVNDYIDRICAKTKGQAAILLFATGVGAGARFTMMDEFAQTIRDLAKERGIECFDVNAYMKAVGKLPLGEKYMADTAHPNAAGHKFVADKLCEFLIAKAGIKDPKPVPPPKPVAPKGKAYSWDFEDGQGDWVLEQNVSISGDRVKDGKQAIKMVCVEDKIDFVRAWSSYLPVQEGQKYTASIDLAAELTGGTAKVFVVEYANNDNKYGAMTAVGSSDNPDWKFFKKSYEVPAKVNYIRILVWVEKKAVGTVYADNVKLIPEE